MSLLVTGILFLAGKELILPPTHSTVVRKPVVQAASVTEAPKTWLAAHVPHASRSAFHSANASAIAVRHNNSSDNDPLEDDDPSFKDISITLSHPVVDPADLSGWMNHVQLPDHAPEIAVIAPHPALGDAGRMEDGSKVNGASFANVKPGLETAAGREIGDEADAEGVSARGVLESLSARGADGTRGKAGMNGRLVVNNGRNGGSGIASNGVRGDGSRGDASILGSVSNESKASAAAIAERQDRERVNWLHDYALNYLPTPSNRGRTFFQLTLAPTVSYRSLNGDNPALEKNGWYPNNGSNGPGGNGANGTGGTNGSFSTSNPKLKNNAAAFGFEFGGSILYRLTRNLSVRGGLQFNFTRYQITEFQTTDPGAVEIVEYTYPGYQADVAHWQQQNQQNQGTNQTSNANGPNGNAPTTNVVNVNNDYLQLSAPVGFELRVLGNERVQLHLAATIQPSYLLGSSAYMVDPDGMKYSKDLEKYRKFNVSTGFEAFLSYRMGAVRWQIGPEFRYQLLSTYSSQYPNTENIRTYGLKVGITKMLP
jgi:hypothetical protein